MFGLKLKQLVSHYSITRFVSGVSRQTRVTYCKPAMNSRTGLNYLCSTWRKHTYRGVLMVWRSYSPPLKICSSIRGVLIILVLPKIITAHSYDMHSNIQGSFTKEVGLLFRYVGQCSYSPHLCCRYVIEYLRRLISLPVSIDLF